MKITKVQLSKATIILFVLLLSTACSFNKSKVAKDITIKVLYSSISAFKQDYGDFLQPAFSHVTFDVIEYEPIFGKAIWNGMKYAPSSEAGSDAPSSRSDWDAQSFVSLIEEKQPDIIFFPPSLATTLLDQSLLMDVTDSLSSKEIANIDAGLKDYFLSKGQSRLYFLSNSYVPQAIVYNEDLLQQVQMDMESSSWDELASISHTINETSDGQLYGFASKFYDDAELFLHIGQDAGFTWYDDFHQQVLIHHPNWHEVLHTFSLLSSETELPTNKTRSEWFEEGKVAMLLADYSTIDKLANNRELPFAWDISAPPVSIDGTMNHHGFQYFNGVASSTTQYETARNVWLYLNSESFAKQRYYSSFLRMELPIYSNILGNKSFNTAALYSITSEGDQAEPSELSSKVMQDIRFYLNQQLQAVKTEQLNVERLDIKQTMQAWKEELDAIIQSH